MGRRAVRGEIGRRADRDLPFVAGHRHGDHVLLDHLAEPNPRIVALSDDVEFGVRDGDVELRRPGWAAAKAASKDRTGTAPRWMRRRA
jgi:hypothetical protein